VIIKHNTPCGVAIGDSLLEAYRKAFACDPMSAFGGIVCLNRRVDTQLASAMTEQFIEVLFAPGYDDDALQLLSAKETMRILDDRDEHRGIATGPQMRQVAGGLLVQDRDDRRERRSDMTVASAREPTDAEWRDLEFAWVVCKHVKSNAIVIARDGATIGIGAGQMSRVDSARMAVEKAQHGVAGGVLASDAFFPFPDAAELGLQAGVTAIVQPGGSVRDNLTIEAVDEVGAAMVFTGRRHFRH
jgi:phosphoribosylaminoimidazolecarboxamide formyltransferase/IMP cyclohydrolase